jgi:hypothetical protein
MAMALTAKMVASEILMCGVKAGIKSIPIVGEFAVNVIDGLQKRHEALNDTARMAEFEAQLSRVERGMRDTVEREIRTILANLGKPAIPGPEMTREMTELRQIHQQGWVPNLFEGILRNSSHWQELRRNPKQYGRILGDHEPVDPESGMHLLIDKDVTRILEVPASSLAFLLGNQSVGIPAADVRAAQDIWAFPSSGARGGVVFPPGFENRGGTDAPDLGDSLVGEWMGIATTGHIRSLKLNSSRSCVLKYSPKIGSGITTRLEGIWKFGEGRIFLEFPGQSSDNEWHGAGDWLIEIISGSNTKMKIAGDTQMISVATGHFDEEEIVKIGKRFDSGDGVH